MKKLILAILVVSLFACSDNEDGDKPLSDLAELMEFTVEANADFTPVKTFIDSELGEVYVFNSTDFEEEDFPMSLVPEIVASPGAKVVPSPGSSVTFDDDEDFINYTITSEDGTNTIEFIFMIRDRQIPNAGFENWFTETGMNSQPFLQPGNYMESTVWATTNMGTSIYSIYGTSPIEENDNTLIKIETVTTVALPLVAGALYLGKFNLDDAIADPTNPVAAAKLGIPFVSKPSSVKLKYSYSSGDQLVQAVLKDPGNLFGGFDIFNLEGKDRFGIEVVLERRIGDAVTVIAQKNIESDQDVETLTDLTLEFDYFTNEEPTHFYISFSPSFDGGTFKGAIGSTLIIDDVEMIYD